MLLARDPAEQVIGLAIGVHLVAGPSLLESVHEACLCHEPEQAGIPFDRQARSPVCYNKVRLDEGFRSDSFADRQLLLEIAADADLSAHGRVAGWSDVQFPCAAAEGRDAAMCRINSSVKLRGPSSPPC